MVAGGSVPAADGDAGGDAAAVVALGPDGPRWTARIDSPGSDGITALGTTPEGILVAAQVEGPTRVRATGDDAARSVEVSGAPGALLLSLRPTGEIGWLTPIETTRYVHIAQVAATTDGDVVLVGWFAGTVRLGDDVLSSAGGTDGLVARLGADGRVAWAHRVGGPASDELGGVAIAGDRIAVVGSFTGQAALPGGSLRSPGKEPHTDVLVAALTMDGTVAWARSVGGTDDDAGHAITLHDTGIAVAATVAGSEVILGLEPDGQDRWTRPLSGTALRALAFTGDTLLAAGSVEQTADHGGAALGGRDVVLLELGTDGAVRTAERWGGAGEDEARAIAVGDGAIYVAGTVTGPSRIADRTSDAAGPAAFVAASRR